MVKKLAVGLLAGALALQACASPGTESTQGPVDPSPSSSASSNSDRATPTQSNPSAPIPTVTVSNPDPSVKAKPKTGSRGRFDFAGARKTIRRVSTAGRGARTGYDRDKFGPAWTDAVSVAGGRNGCDTRNDILQRDLTSKSYRNGSRCVVVEGRLIDPYTRQMIKFEKSRAWYVQIDHMVPLSYAWQMGASRWTEDKRRNFANDPLNLLAVDGPTNMSKSDSGPASWLPPNRSYRCAYSLRFAKVAIAYNMPVTPADKQVMLRQCDH